MEQIHIEVVRKPESFVNAEVLASECKSFIEDNPITIGTTIKNFESNLVLTKYVDYITVSESGNNALSKIDPKHCDVNYHIYTLDTFGAQVETSEHGEEEIQLATHWVLPTIEFFNLWENLIYDTDIKQKLLNYASTTMLFAELDIDPNVICCNRVILLHGPPGTGKTSLCRALAQKLSIRLKDRFQRSQLVEINSHSLFSKWFSESGKLVTKMFSKVIELVEDQQTLVFVLIDEVESLAHARQQCMSGNEPSDSIRVVNAVLTQIDQLKRYRNVMLLTTSNMTEAIDLAFVDRADIKQFIGLPGEGAIYHIYYTCLQELFRKNLISPSEEILMYHALKELGSDKCSKSKKLLEISMHSVGLSGRTLRKIPFLAHAIYLKKPSVMLSEYLEAMEKIVWDQKNMEQNGH